MTELDGRRTNLRLRIGLIAAAVLLAAAACSGGSTPPPDGPSVVVTTSVLGAVVRDLVGDRAAVTVLMGNGVDPHDWSPSAKDIERVMGADLVVTNGLGLEHGLQGTLAEAEKAGVPVFRATDHVTVREMEASATPSGAANERGPGDPHFWVDPLSMRAVVGGLVEELAAAGIETTDRGTDLQQRLADLDAEVRSTLAVVPDDRRRLVTGHGSMGYFADRYGFTLVGTVIPGLSSQGEVSAGELATLKAAIHDQGVQAIFAEVGTPAAVVEAISRETGVQVVMLPSHTLPDDGSYFTFIREIAAAVAGALR